MWRESATMGAAILACEVHRERGMFGLQLNHKELCELCLRLRINIIYVGFIDKTPKGN